MWRRTASVYEANNKTKNTIVVFEKGSKQLSWLTIDWEPNRQDNDLRSMKYSVWMLLMALWLIERETLTKASILLFTLQFSSMMILLVPRIEIDTNNNGYARTTCSPLRHSSDQVFLWMKRDFGVCWENNHVTEVEPTVSVKQLSYGFLSNVSSKSSKSCCVISFILQIHLVFTKTLKLFVHFRLWLGGVFFFAIW